MQHTVLTLQVPTTQWR